MTPTPKDEAKRLIELFYKLTEFTPYAKLSAKICVEEIIKSEPTNLFTDFYHELVSDLIEDNVNFWQQVKTEIENYQ